MKRRIKRGLSLLLAGALIFNTGSITAFASTKEVAIESAEDRAGAEEILLSQGKSVTASRVESGNQVEKAVDGDEKSRWATASYKKYAGYDTVPDRNWIAVDLGKVCNITRFHLNWEGAYARNWELQVSNDGGSYQTVYTGTTSKSGKQDFTLDTAASGRYVRLYANELYNIEWGCSLWEFQVFGTETNETGKDAIKLTTVNTENVQWFMDENGGWINDKEEVKVYVIPKEGHELTALTANGKDVLGNWDESTKLLTLDNVTEDTKFRAAVDGEDIDSQDRHREAETATCGSDKKWSVNKNTNASGGAVAGSTGNKIFIFEDIPESNKIAMKYAAPSSGGVYVEVLINNKWESAGAITFATTQSWDMASGNVVYSEGIYIPEGSAVKITPAQDVDLDYFEFLSGPLNEEENLAEGVVLAKNSTVSNGEQVADLMSLVGTSVKLGVGGTIDFLVPEGDDWNTYTLGYRTESSAEISVKIGEQEPKNILLSATPANYYGTKGRMDVIGLTGGSHVTVTLTEGEEVFVDYLQLRSAQAPQEAMEIDTNVEAGNRETICLDGVWSCTSTAAVTKPETASIPMVFDNTIPVPGLWTSAAVDMGAFATKSLWYQKSIVLPEDFNSDGELTVALQILRAEYGRWVYVNGEYVDSYPYNFTNSTMDITSYLKGGKNDIVVLLGNLNDQKRDPNNVAHTGTDIERNQYEPGFTDSVNLILNRQPAVTSVQTAADLENSSVKVRVKLANGTDEQKSTDVTVKLYELGVFENGQAPMRKQVGSYTEQNVSLEADSTAQVDIDAIKIEDFDISKAWEPGNPYLYEIEVHTSGDTFSRRFGMRTFEFDRETKEPMLNGKIHRLLGTNVALGRFYEDPNRGTLPWQEEWVRELYWEFQDTNWEIFRTHNCPLPGFWYDLADEMGLMIVDEYAIWYCNDAHKCTTESMMPEYKAMVDEKQTHPSILWWDAQNETTGVPATGECAKILMEEGYDIADRSWDNGWSKPVDEYQPVEYHPYPFWNVGKDLDTLNSTNDQVPFNGGENSGTIKNPKIVNEYASLWVNRIGEATYISADNFEYLLPKDATNRDRQNYYNRAVAYSTEFWRAGRNIAGIQQFTGLSYSKPGTTGATSDVLMPDIAHPKVWDFMKARMKDSFNRLGIGIKLYDVKTGPGWNYSFPVSVYNDLNEDVNDLPVTLTVAAGGRVLHQETKTFSVSEATAKGADGTSPDTMVQNFEYTMPQYGIPDGTIVTVTASYTRNSETVSSIREMTWEQKAPLQLKATAGSYHNGQEPAKALDKNEGTIWHTEWTDQNRANFWIDLQVTTGKTAVNKFRYLPRNPGSNGKDTNGTITKYKLVASYDNGKTYATDGKENVIAEGTFTEDYGWKEVDFETTELTNLRLYALESKNNNASAAEVELAYVDDGELEEVNVVNVMLNTEQIELDLDEGSTKFQLMATVIPENATNQTVIWESSNEDVVQVNETGLVTAIGEGTAVVTVKTEDGNRSFDCTVKVNDTKKAAAQRRVEMAKESLKAPVVEDKDTIALVTSHENGCKIVWTAPQNSPIQIASDGKNASVVRGDTDVTVKLTAEIIDGTETDVRDTITFDVTIPAKISKEIAKAKELIEGHTYKVSQITANDEDAVKGWLAEEINKIAGISDTGVEIAKSQIAISEFKAAEAGIEANAQGTDGSFKFTVELAKGADSGSAEGMGTIQAAQYTQPTPVPADKKALQAAVEAAISVDKKDEYTADSWKAYEEALKAAQDMLEKEDAAQEEVNAAEKALTDVQKALKKAEKPTPVPADKKALQEAINAAISADKKDEYTADSWKAYEEALKAAKDMFEKADAAQEEVNAAEKALTDAQKALKKAEKPTPVPADKKVLQAAVEAAISADKKDEYTADSWKTYEEALKAAQDMLEKEDAAQEEVDAAEKALTDAQKALKEAEKPTPVPADKKALREVVNAAASMKQADYTAETWAALQSVLKAAQDMLEKEDATQAEVDEAAKAVDAAVAALVKATQPKPPVDHSKHIGKTFVVGNLKYKITKDDGKVQEVRVTSLKNKKASKLVIPAKVTCKELKETFKVTTVKAKAFKGKKIKKAIIGANVKSIGPNAFLNCKNLKTVTIGKSVKTIGIRAFNGCMKLKKITVKSKVLKNVKKNAFKKISKKAVIKVPKGKKKAYAKRFKGKIAKGVKIK